MTDLITKSSEEIMTTLYKPMVFAVDGLFAQGLYLLAGSPKVGKSWLALQLCLAVAKGERMFDRLTLQGSALYFCLEDSYQRIQNRLYELTDAPSDKLFFALKADTIGNGLEDQIVSFKAQHDDLRLVVIDTLQMVRNETESTYGSDYADLLPLKGLAAQLGITIILVHHLRKAADSDPFNMISGSNGLGGCSDGQLVLRNTIFKQADKELLIPYNPAAKATPPKAGKPKVNFFEYEELEAIQAAADKLPIKWRTVIHLLMITGCRRAELCGLKWDAIEWEKQRIFIHIDLLYDPEHGIYEDTTKTEGSERYVKLPQESLDLLREYKAWYDEQRAIYSSRCHDTNFLFFQEKSGKEGLPMSPDTVTRFLDEFSEREGLPHLNPHTFRHTMASILCYNHIDPVSISHRLGHSRVSTTTDYYSHMFKEADDINAETIADIVLRRGKSRSVTDIGGRADESEAKDCG